MATTWANSGINPAVGAKAVVSQDVTAAAKITGVTQLAIDMNKWNMAWITVTAQDIRYFFDGTSPSATVGHILKADSSPLKITGKARIFEFRMAAVSGTAKVTVTLDDAANAGGVV